MAVRKAGLLALLALAADQWLKAIFRGADQALIPGLVKLFGVLNTGVSFGFFSEHPELVTLFSLALILLAGAFLRRLPLLGAGLWGAGLLLGGALGNFLDRLVYGGVIDYVQLLFMDFPVFNLADVCIILGAGLLVISTFSTPEGRH
ncbi:MAG: signal peptidase II [Clostridiales bacterium]|nr:signal peptidase II [Clostridiales bacterium]